jgi:hypothetical protein
MLIFPIRSPSQVTYTINSTIIPHILDYHRQCLSTLAASTFLTRLAVPVRPQPSQKLFKLFLKQALGSVYCLSHNWNIYHNTTQHKKPKQPSIDVDSSVDRPRPSALHAVLTRYRHHFKMDYVNCHKRLGQCVRHSSYLGTKQGLRITI